MDILKTINSKVDGKRTEISTAVMVLINLIQSFGLISLTDEQLTLINQLLVFVILIFFKASVKKIENKVNKQ